MSPHPLAERLLTLSSTAFLLVTPFTSSAGWRAATLLVAFSCLVFLAATRSLELPRPAPRALLAALTAWCILASASVLWSVDIAQTLGELRREILYGALALTVFYLSADARRWKAWWPAMLIAAIVLFVAENLRDALAPRWGLRVWDGGGGAFSTHLVILAPLLLPLAWSAREGERTRMGLFLAALVLLFAAAWNTGNRIVWAALLVSFAIAALAFRASRHRPHVQRARYIALAVLGVLCILFAEAARHRVELQAAAPVAPTAGLQGDLRPRLWIVAGEQIEKAPWLGLGYGREIAAAAFRPETPPWHPEVLHAHNVFLNVAVQLGLVGLALFVSILLLVAREFLKALRDPESCPFGIMGLAVLGGFITKNLTDDFLFRHNGLFFWAVTGMLLGLTRLRARA